MGCYIKNQRNIYIVLNSSNDWHIQFMGCLDIDDVMQHNRYSHLSELKVVSPDGLINKAFALDNTALNYNNGSDGNSYYTEKVSKSPSKEIKDLDNLEERDFWVEERTKSSLESVVQRASVVQSCDGSFLVILDRNDYHDIKQSKTTVINSTHALLKSDKKIKKFTLVKKDGLGSSKDLDLSLRHTAVTKNDQGHDAYEKIHLRRKLNVSDVESSSYHEEDQLKLSDEDESWLNAHSSLGLKRIGNETPQSDLQDNGGIDLEEDRESNEAQLVSVILSALLRRLLIVVLFL